jgi:hypothetical protein
MSRIPRSSGPRGSRFAGFRKGAGAEATGAGAETTDAGAETTGAGAETTDAGAETTGAGAETTGAGAGKFLGAGAEGAEPFLELEPARL